MQSPTGKVKVRLLVESIPTLIDSVNDIIIYYLTTGRGRSPGQRRLSAKNM